jgi:hypothetical protein
MKAYGPDEHRELAAYLLGRASEADATALEDRYFENDETFATLEAVADDLADRYATGRLSADDRVRFERHCLSSSDDRLRVRVSRVLAGRPPSDQPARVSLFDRIAGAFRPGQPGLRLVVAAASVLVVAGASILALRVSRLSGDVGRLQSEIEIQRQAVDAAGERLKQETARRESLEQQLSARRSVRFDLIAGLDRGAGVELRIPADATTVRFDLALDRPASSGRYRGTIRTSDRTIVWSQALPDTAATSRAVTIEVPGGVLTAGQYEIVLQAVAPDGTLAEIATYSLQVRRGA